MEVKSIVQRFAILAFNAQDSLRMTVAKRCALRCVGAAAILEMGLENSGETFTDPLTLQLDSNNTSLYRELVFHWAAKGKDTGTYSLKEWLNRASSLHGARLKQLERETADALRGAGLLDEVPNLMGCDFYYVTAEVTIREYRSQEAAYDRELEWLRAVLLEEYEPDDADVAMVWLLMESGCFHDLFSEKELARVSQVLNSWYRKNPLAKALFEIHISRGLENGMKAYLDTKKRVMGTQTGIGVNFVFPVLQRSQSIFIDTEEWFSNQEKRLWDTVARLEKYGHEVTVLRAGAVPLLRIDNLLYEAVPTEIGGKVPVTGVRLRRYQI